MTRRHSEGQESLFDAYVAGLEPDIARRALDELFSVARRYKTSAAFRDLIDFVVRFRAYSPFNAMLVHIQMPGATFVAPPYRWLREHGRCIRAEARPLVILQPMGPVMFVFDVSDTDALEGAPALPPEVESPFEVRGGRIREELSLTIENSARDGIRVAERQAGSQSAGEIRAATGGTLKFLVKKKPEPQFIDVPACYELLLNSRHSAEAKYATLVHELGHLYCGHLGTPNLKWWPDRSRMSHDLREFEAESVSYLLCGRLGIDNPSAEYLGHYVRDHEDTPEISLECVVKAAGLVEQMGRERLKPRKEKE